MDISGLKTKVEAWVPYLEGVDLLVEYLARDEMRELSKQAVTRQYDFETRKHAEKFDQALAEKIICQRVVKDWHGFEDEGKPFPCTPENVAYLAEKLTGFALFINRVCVDLQALADIEREEQEKN